MDKEIQIPPVIGKILGWVAAVIIVLCCVILWDAARKNPSSKPRPQDETLNIYSMMDTCKELILKQLKAPSTASFEDDSSNQPQGSSDLIWNSSVDSENSFGAKLRTQFTCTYTHSTDTVNAVLKQ